MLESVVVLSSGARLGLADLPPEYGGAAAEASSPAAPAPSLIEEEADGDTPAPAAGPTSAAPGGEPTYEAGLPMAELEKRHILKTLAEQGHNRTRAARVLGIGRRTLQRKLEEYKEAGEEIPPPAPD